MVSIIIFGVLELIHKTLKTCGLKRVVRKVKKWISGQKSAWKPTVVPLALKGAHQLQNAASVYAQENGITKINRWRQSYLEYIRAHVGAFIGDAKKNRFIRLFLMREGLLDVKGSELLLKFQLEKFRQGEDVGGPLKITITQCEE